MSVQTTRLLNKLIRQAVKEQISLVESKRHDTGKIMLGVAERPASPRGRKNTKKAEEDQEKVDLAMIKLLRTATNRNYSKK